MPLELQVYIFDKIDTINYARCRLVCRTVKYILDYHRPLAKELEIYEKEYASGCIACGTTGAHHLLEFEDDWEFNHINMLRPCKHVDVCQNDICWEFFDDYNFRDGKPGSSHLDQATRQFVRSKRKFQNEHFSSCIYCIIVGIPAEEQFDSWVEMSAGVENIRSFAEEDGENKKISFLDTVEYRTGVAVEYHYGIEYIYKEGFAVGRRLRNMKRRIVALEQKDRA